MEKGGASGLFGKGKKYLLILALIAILFSLFNMIYLTVKISDFQEYEKISTKAVNANINVCLDVAPPNMSHIGDLVAYANQNFIFKVNATSPSNRTVYYFDDTDLFDIDPDNGWIDFIPTMDQVGSYTVNIWSTHNICGINTSESIQFIVISSRAPVWLNSTPVNQNITEGSPFFLNLSQYVYDPDNDTIYFFSNNSYSEFPSYNLTIVGILNFTTDDIDVGVHAVMMNASDLSNYSTKNFTFTIINVNDIPVMTPFPSRFDLCEDTYFDYTIDATDGDLNIPNSPEELFFYDNSPMFVIDEQTGRILFNPSSNYSGHNPTRIYVTDEEAIDYQNTDFYIIPVNDAPVMEEIGAKTIWVNDTWNYYVPVSDEEDGVNIGGNLTFTDNTDLFNISETNGQIIFTPTDEQVGTYNVTICVEDKGIPQPENYSLCGNDSYLPITVCQNFSLTVTTLNRPPVITSYFPTDLDLQIQETDSITFMITKEDPDGTIPTTYWYKNNQLVNMSYDNWTFSTTYGSAGFYVIKVEITDGLLNDSMEWNVTVAVKPIPPVPPPSGGGIPCEEAWKCTDWFDCVNFSRISFNESWSRVSKTAWADIWKTGCQEKGISLDVCGIQIRYCEDLSSCGSSTRMPAEYMSCRVSPPPSCDDGIRNCHHGSCELLIDCGGVCNPCPAEMNRTEYPRGRGVCEDNVCEMSELFTCRDCYMFWVLCLSALLSILAILYIIRRRKVMIIAKQNELRRKEKIERIRENILEIERDMELKDFRNARLIFRKTEKMVSSIKETETKAIRRKLWGLKKELVGERRYSK